MNKKSNKIKIILLSVIFILIISVALGLFLFKGSIFTQKSSGSPSINSQKPELTDSRTALGLESDSSTAASIDSYLAFADHPLSVMITNLENDLVSGYVRVRYTNTPKIWSPQWEINGQTYQHLAGPGEFYIELSPYPRDDLLYHAKYLRVFKHTFTQQDIDQGSVRISYDPDQALPNKQTHPELSFITPSPYPTINIKSITPPPQYNFTADQLLASINQHRTREGTPILKVHPYLCESIAHIINLIKNEQLEPNQAFETAVQNNPPGNGSITNVRFHFAQDHYDLDQLIQSWSENNDQTNIPLLKDGAYKYTCIVTYSRYVILLAGF